jgi:hypothetical protein
LHARSTRRLALRTAAGFVGFCSLAFLLSIYVLGALRGRLLGSVRLGVHIVPGRFRRKLEINSSIRFIQYICS